MRLVEITEREPWERFHARHDWAQFTQSWAWGEFRATRGFRIRRFALVDDTGEWLCAAQLEYHPKSLVGGYWFASRGPVFSSHLDADALRECFATFLKYLEAQKLERSLFWRFEPLIELTKPEGLIPMSFRRTNPLNPSSTILLALEPSQEALLAAMHQKTRYNIRVAARHGVTTRLATSPDDMTRFLELMDETAARDEFTQHDRDYLAATCETLQREGMGRIRLAEHAGKVLAANLEIVYGDTVTYLHGSSSSASREVMAPFALHWDAIMDAKRSGAQYYDFWGANPESKAAFAYKPSWEGITRFKRGWGGAQMDLYGTWDLPFNPLLYRLAFMRNFFRG